MSLPRRIAGAVFRAFLMIFYYVVLTPYAWLLRALGLPLLDLRPDGRESYWVPKPSSDDRDRYRGEF